MASLAPPVNPPPVALFPTRAADIIALRDAISPARLSTYLKRTHGNVRRAFDLYAWNVRAGAALYPILQVNEVALRNAVNRALVSQFGADWPYSQGFLRNLPRPERETFEHGRRKLERNLGVARAATGDVVAAQTYWFWVVLLTSRFEQRIWSREFAASFPSAPRRIDREIVYRRADAIRRLRNRIAHWEPLLDYDLVGARQRADSMVRWISPATSMWVAARWPLARDVLTHP
jgi:hypothetical protein